MGPPEVDTRTPIRIRGKRFRNTPREVPKKERRNPQLRKSRASSSTISATSSEVSSSRPRKRRRKLEEDYSPLEQLPVEVLQQIFELSANVDLPFVSRQLALKLSKSSHLQLQITSRVLRPILGYEDGSVVAITLLAKATRLLNSRFMTWHFFKSWLRSLPEASEWELENSDDEERFQWMWSDLRPAPNLLPPKKLLCSPFTADKISLLWVLTEQQWPDITSIDPTYGELAQEGLTSAVQQGHVVMAGMLLHLGLQVSTQLLRVAVLDLDCDMDMVQTILGRGPSMRKNSSIDLLDPSIWSWASKAKARGDFEGEWLMKLLRERSNSSEAASAGSAS